MGRRTLEPYQTVVVHMSKDGRDCAAVFPIQPRRLRTPCAPIDVCEEKLVHPIIGGIGFQQDLADFGIGRGLSRHERIISGTVSCGSVSKLIYAQDPAGPSFRVS